jgi:hypothetical protein
VHASADGGGGVFVAWENRSTDGGETGADIYAQHVGSNGAPLVRDIRICTSFENQQRPQIAADGSGGAYVVWEDMRGGNADIYIERINALGGSVWETNLPVCAAALAQTRPQIVEDGAGGVIVAWTDRRTGSEYIGAQRILPTGAPAWQTDGILVCPAPGIVASCRLISDRRGGAVVAWLAQGSGGPEMRAQRILPGGRPAWDPAGVALCPAALEPGNLAVAPDGSGGIIAAWDDRRGEWIGQVYHPVKDIDRVEYQRDIYAQRVTAGGSAAWTPGGVAVAALPRNQEAPRITYDGAGGAIVAWSDKRDSRWLDAGELNIPEDENNFDIFAQRIDSAGNALWRANGEPLCAEPDGQLNAALTADHGPGVFVAWEDASEAGPRVRIQKIAGSYSARRCAIAATIKRNGASYDASGAVFSGCPGGDLDTLRVVCDFVDGDMAEIPSVSPAEIELAAEGQGLSFCDPANAGTPGTPENGYRVTLIRSRLKGCGGCPGGGCALAGDPPQRLTLRYAGSVLGSVDGLRIRSVDARGDGAVTALTNDGMGPAFGRTSNDAAYRRCYDFDDSGRIDQNDLSCMASHYGHGGATAAVPPVRSALADVGLRFIVRRLDEGGGASKLAVTIMLENARGLSSLLLALDNGSPRIAYRRWIPATHLHLRFPAATAVRDGRALLCVAGYGLRAIDSPSVEMCAFECDIADGDTAAAGEISWADEAPLVFCEYVDAEGRVGSIAAPAYEEAPAVIGNVLRACYPNPFNPKTTIAYSIAERGLVTLRIYTVSGQLVKTLVNSSQAPRVSGYSVEWDGRNDNGAAVASGVYLYRLSARDFCETKKIVLLR